VSTRDGISAMKIEQNRSQDTISVVGIAFCRSKFERTTALVIEIWLKLKDRLRGRCSDLRAYMPSHEQIGH
jgi:hypothetical protein